MPESFPITHRASRVAGVGAIAMGLGAMVLATRTTVTSTAWIGTVFPGFMLLDNRVIASVSLANWAGAVVPDLSGSEVVAVGGIPIRSSAQVYALLAAVPPGTPLAYRLRKQGHERDVTIQAQRFTLRDWALLFGAFLLNGITYLTSGLVVWVLRPRALLGRALLSFGTSGA